MAPDVSIIVLNYRTPKLVVYNLLGLDKLNIPVNYEIILIDNGSGDQSETLFNQELIGKIKNLTYVSTGRNLGFAGGNNVGIRRARGRYVLILNPDATFLEASAIPRAIKYLDEHPDVAVLGPKLLNPDRSLQLTCYTDPPWYLPLIRRTILGKTKWGRAANRHYLMEDFDHSSARDVDWVLGAAMFVRRSAIDEVGLFDERYFLYFEDADWCRRFRKAGWRVIYAPIAEVVHYHRRESADVGILRALTNRVTRAHLASAWKYFWKWRRINGI